MRKRMMVLAGAMLLFGCATSYSWRSEVPTEMRTVAVPTFRNDSSLTEFGSLATRQVLREFQREGTFSIRPSGDAAIEIQGTIKLIRLGVLAYNRRLNLRTSSDEFTATAEVSVIDKRNGCVMIDNRQYSARTTLTLGKDNETAKRDASGRLADDLARQIVDDVLKLKW